VTSWGRRAGAGPALQPPIVEHTKMTNAKTRPGCKLCGGTAGQLNERGEHNLCTARAARGLATPSLGNCCEACHGSGTQGRGGVMLSFDCGPATIARSIQAQFPPCPNCKGSGRVVN
jgi:hypothetical protein